MSVMTDLSALASCENTAGTQNCGEDTGEGNNKKFPDITTGGNYNTAYGFTIDGMNITTGKENTVLGYDALKTLTTGDYNVALGSQSLQSTNGSSNTALGYKAGYHSTGSNNIFIGKEAGPTINNADNNKLYINNSSGTPLIAGDFSSDEVTINGSLDITGT